MIIPREIQDIVKQLQEQKFEAFLVGGCVRDLILGEIEGSPIEPEDWDIATNAKPENILKVFPKSFYENKFLTVTVQIKSKNPKLKEVEITTYRLEAKYTDKRHPDEIRFAETLEEDLKRRDFTINAMALAIGEKLEIRNSKLETNSKFQIPNSKLLLIDLFAGQNDLKNRIIRAVGTPEDRFGEDALRMLRAVRFATTLGFSAKGGPASGGEIEQKTAEAIKKNAAWLEAISKERIRDEFLKIIMSSRPAEGIELLRKLGLLRYIIPELEEGYKVGQNKHHIYDCYEHSLRSLDYAAKKGFNKYVRIAALLHDVGKPRSKRGEGPDSTFYNHEIIGARMVNQILSRLRLSKKDIEKITKLVRYHLFYYNVGEVGESSVRRLVRRMGIENMEELLQVRMADRIGSGVPKAEPYKLRHLKYLIEKTGRDPLSVKMLEVNGKDIMDILKIPPGPKIGLILDILLGYVLAVPEKNKADFLKEKIRELGNLPDKELKEKAEKARKEREKIEMKKDAMTKKKYWVT